jgi:DNA-binding response OmpR family regulator
MSKATVLICDDNIAVHESLKSYLREDNISVISVCDGESALEQLRLNNVDLVILDIMLPGISGTNVCREIRKSSVVAIIILSAKSEELDRIIGFELGADDYVTKPFSPREVARRVNAILRRLHTAGERKKLSFAELSIFPEAYEAYVGDEKLEMTPKEIEILSYIVANAGKVLSREQIISAVWGYDYYGDTRAVDTQIKRLRQKLPCGASFIIRSVYGVGYKLEAIS